MGQKQSSPYDQYQKQYNLVSKNDNDEILIRHKQNGKEYMLRKIIVKSEQQLEERMNLLSKRKKIKSQHLLNIVDYKPLVDDKICGNTKYISLLIQYPFQSLFYETIHRLTHTATSHRASTHRLSPLYFQQHQLWSILYSCALGLEVLYLSDLTHQCISKDIIFIDKQGVVKIGDPVIIGLRRNFEKVIDKIEKEKSKQEKQTNNQNQLLNSNFYVNDANQNYLKKLNHIKDSKIIQQENKNSSELGFLSKRQQTKKNQFTSIIQKQQSIIISPELLSLCKDHQYYFFDKQKSDVFTLGALMVQLGCLQNICSYNPKQNVFKKQTNQLQQWGEKLRKKYSSAFACLVEQMIKMDPKQRISLSKIIEKIEQFSIQQNSRTQESEINNNGEQVKGLARSVEAKEMNGGNLLTAKDTGMFKRNGLNCSVPNQNTFQSKDLNFLNGINPFSFNRPQATNSYSFDFNNLYNTGPKQEQSYSNLHFPSFSSNNQNPTHYQQLSNNFTNTNPSNNFTNPANQFYHQSAVKSLFSNKLPVEIKYTQSPLIIPVSNIRPNHQKRYDNQKFYTPFNQLNLTSSNSKNQPQITAQKQSIVQNKFTLNNENPNYYQSNLLPKFNAPLFKTQTVQSQRFSLNNFGKIQIPQNLNFSNNTSVHTSMIPTPRFQNASNPWIQSNNSPSNNFSSQLINQTSVSSTFPNYPLNSANQYQGNPNRNNQKNQYDNIMKQHEGSSELKEGNYNAKKQGFSINGNDKGYIQIIDKKYNQQPYFSNSSVGYTLPKYKPDSVSSQVVRSVNQRQNITQNNSNNLQRFKIHNLSPGKEHKNKFNQLIHNQQQNDQKKNLIRNHSSASSMINAVSNLIDKNETNSNASSQNTVKKQNHNLNYNKQSGQKKYNFYKRQLNQKLQKIQEPLSHQISQISSISMIDPSSNNKTMTNQSNYHSPIYQQQHHSQEYLQKQSDCSVTPITFQPQFHSIFVQQQEEGGSFYRGFKVNNFKQGTGLLYFTDGGYYDGQFNQDMMEGYGKLYYNQKDLAYEGQFMRNNFHGYGMLFNDKPKQLNEKFDFANLNNIGDYWKIFKGYFKDDQKAGKCTIIFTNGEQFQGFCQNNTIQGNGRFKNLQGQYIDGLWKNNVLVQIKDQGKLQNNGK